MSLSVPSSAVRHRDPVADENWPHLPDLGDGTFRNPILFADYSDPDVIRHGEDFYMTASSFNCTPGLPILHSCDLVNWTLIAHAVVNLPHPRYSSVQHGCGIWAPALRFHAGKFWIFFPTPDEGIYVTTAAHPRGPWSQPHLLQAGKGLIDPCPLWEENGTAYLVHAYAASRAGIKHQLRVCPMAPDGRSLLGAGHVVFHQPEKHPTLEGPKFLKRNGWYYILAPAGGVEHGWQVALRSRSVFGPYEDKVVLEQGVTPVNGPHQGALVDSPDGKWWFIHFQDEGVYGRILHLQPVAWKDGWPQIGLDQDGNGIGEPVAQFQKPLRSDVRSDAIGLQCSDDFNLPALGLQWQWQANHAANWCSLAARKDWLRLHCLPCPPGSVNLWTVPNLLLQKLPAPHFSVSAKLDFSGLKPGDKAGLIMMGEDYSYLAVERTGDGCRLIKAVCCQAAKGKAETLEEEAAISGNIVRMQLDVARGARCVFKHSTDEAAFIAAGKPFKASKGLWIGAKVGLFAIHAGGTANGGSGDFDYLRFSPIECL